MESQSQAAWFIMMDIMRLSVEESGSLDAYYIQGQISRQQAEGIRMKGDARGMV